jgi:hypothetical protein
MKPQSIQAIGIVLSIAYWALVLFGIQSYVNFRLFTGVMEDYMKKNNEERYFNDIKEIARENKLVNLLFNVIWSSNHNRKDRYKGMNIVLSSYVEIAFLLWLFVILL